MPLVPGGQHLGLTWNATAEHRCISGGAQLTGRDSEGTPGGGWAGEPVRRSGAQGDRRRQAPLCSGGYHDETRSGWVRGYVG